MFRIKYLGYVGEIGIFYHPVLNSTQMTRDLPSCTHQDQIYGRYKSSLYKGGIMECMSVRWVVCILNLFMMGRFWIDKYFLRLVYLSQLLCHTMCFGLWLYSEILFDLFWWIDLDDCSYCDLWAVSDMTCQFYSLFSSFVLFVIKLWLRVVWTF